MAIHQSDIKFKESQRMDDTLDGGGRITGQVIVDGTENSIFPDISDLDRATGSVSLRKVYLHVDNPTDDKYSGANIALIEPPEDESVSVTLMSTFDHYDTRKDAKDVIERYLARSSLWPGSLLGDQLRGQRTIRIVQRDDYREPNVGEVLSLISNESKDNEYEQYIRIVDYSSEIRTFTVQNSGSLQSFQRRVITAEISEPLRETFKGGEPSPVDFNTTETTLRETIVANAVKYYGVSTLVNDAAFGSMTLNVDDIFTQLVPSSRIETPVTDVNALGQKTSLTGSGALHETTVSTLLEPYKSLFLGSSIAHGSLVVEYGSITMTDDSNENLLLDGVVVASIDYQTGVIEFNENMQVLNGNTKVKFITAALQKTTANSDSIEIDSTNRGYSYVRELAPIPSPGTLVVSYMVQGKWYTLIDKGAGVLTGSSDKVGTGSVDFNTGTLTLTLGALPDAKTHIVMQWGTTFSVIDRTSDNTIQPWFIIDLPQNATATAPVVKWGNKQASESGGDGVLIHDATKNLIKFRPHVLQSKSTEFTIDFDVLGSINSASRPVTFLNDVFTIELGESVQPGTVYFEVSASTVETDQQGREGQYNQLRYYFYDAATTYPCFDDGYGRLKNTYGEQVASINYQTGVIQIQRSLSLSVARDVKYKYYKYIFLRRDKSVTNVTINDMSSLNVRYGGLSSNASDSFAFKCEKLIIDVPRSNDERLIPNTTRFWLAGKYYFEHDGKLYNEIDHATGARGPSVGSVQSLSAQIQVDNWQAEQYVNFARVAFSTSLDYNQVDSNAVFRTIAAPLAPQSMTLSFVAPEGGRHSVTSDASGALISALVTGKVDHQTGVVTFETNEGVDMSTLRYSCVTYSNLPLDADLIGLDPVRLPSDGRVPTVTKGDVVLVHQTDTITATVGPNMVIDLNKPRLASVSVEGIESSDYVTDLNAGKITFAQSVLSAERVISYRYEDMAVATDVDISGTVRLAKPLSHDYKAQKAKVSSLLVAKSLWSRYTGLFDQRTWTGEWSDSLIGEQTSAQYNDADHPITTDNLGAITERWAIVFTSNTSFKLIGEHTGQIAIGSTNSEFAPLNPNTSTPYFTVPHLGWGDGWAAGNVLRFNTVGAIFPIWLILTVLQSTPSSAERERFQFEARGNINR